jgi:WD40 repeat protein
MTGESLVSLNLIPNIALKKAIADYVAGNEDRQRELEESRNVDLVKARTEATARILPYSNSSSSSAVMGTSPTTTSSTTSSVTVVPIEPPPWEFEKTKLAYPTKSSTPAKRLVIVSASRLSNFSGTGLMLLWETTPDGLQFQPVSKTELVPESKTKPETTVSALCTLSDDRFVVGLRDGTLGIWQARRNVKDGKLSLLRIGGSSLKLDMERHRDAITDVHYYAGRTQLLGNAAPDLLVSSSRDYTVKLWQKQQQQQTTNTTTTTATNEIWTSVATLSGHRGEVWCVTSMESYVISGGADWNLLLWDPESPDAPANKLEGHRRPVRCCATTTTYQNQSTTMNQYNNLIASGSEDETVRIWDIRCSPGQDSVAVLETGSPVLTCEWGDGFLSAGGGVPIDAMFGTSDNIGGWVRMWDPRTWKVLGDAAKILPRVGDRIQKSRVTANGDVDIKRQAHELATTCLVTLRVAGLPAILSGGDDKKLRLWSSSPRDESLAPFFPRPTLGYEFGGDPHIPLKVDAVGVLMV